VQKVVVSELLNDTDGGNMEDDLDVLDDYEIKEMFNKIKYEVDDKIKKHQDKLVMLLSRINIMEKNITNLNFIADINNNLDKFFEKNYI